MYVKKNIAKIQIWIEVQDTFWFSGSMIRIKRGFWCRPPTPIPKCSLGSFLFGISPFKRCHSWFARIAENRSLRSSIILESYKLSQISSILLGIMRVFWNFTLRRSSAETSLPTILTFLMKVKYVCNRRIPYALSCNVTVFLCRSVLVWAMTVSRRSWSCWICNELRS